MNGLLFTVFLNSNWIVSFFRWTVWIKKSATWKRGQDRSVKMGVFDKFLDIMKLNDDDYDDDEFYDDDLIYGFDY